MTTRGDDFRREYHVNNDGELYALDSWTTPGGERVTRRTTDISDEDYQIDREDIKLAYLEYHTELAARRRGA